MKKHRIAVGIELFLFSIIVAILGTYASVENPPSNGVKYINNGQTTVEGALNDLYSKIGSSSSSSCLPSRSADASTIPSGSSRTYLSGSYANGWTVKCESKTCSTCQTCESQGYSKIKTGTFTTVKGSGYTTINIGFKPKKLYILHKVSEGTLSWLYDESISTTQYWRDGWKTFSKENSDTGYALKITNTGFTLGHFNSLFTLTYVAVY